MEVSSFHPPVFFVKFKWDILDNPVEFPYEKGLLHINSTLLEMQTTQANSLVIGKSVSVLTILTKSF